MTFWLGGFLLLIIVNITIINKMSTMDTETIPIIITVPVDIACCSSTSSETIQIMK